MSGGRAGWNLVTSANAAEAHNFGSDRHAAKSDRYRRAAEFAAVWQPVPTPLDDLIANKAKLLVACEKIGRKIPPEIRMSFRINVSDITGKDPHGPNGDRLAGHGSVDDIAADIRKYRDDADLDQFQLNFNGCGSLEQLEESMTVFMEQVRPMVDG